MAQGADAGQDDPVVQLAPLLGGVSRRHDAIAAQITRKILHGQQQIEASRRIQQKKRSGPPKTFTVNPSMFSAAIGALTAVARAGASEHDDVQRHFNFLRELVQKVVIAPSADGKSAELTIHGRLVGVIASMQAFQDYTAGLREQHANEFARRVRAGEFKEREEKMAYLNRFEAVLAEEET